MVTYNSEIISPPYAAEDQDDTYPQNGILLVVMTYGLVGGHHPKRSHGSTTKENKIGVFTGERKISCPGQDSNLGRRQSKTTACETHHPTTNAA
jgi:hypothetical protein